MTITPEQVAENAKAGTQGEWEAFRNSSFWEVRPKIRGENDPFTISDVCASEPGNPDGGRQEAHARRIASVPDMEALIAQQAAEIERLREVLAFIDDKISWEISPSNYDHDQVCKMNADWCEIGSVASAALIGGPDQ